MEAWREGGPVAVYASSAFYANELLWRVDKQAVNGLPDGKTDKRTGEGGLPIVCFAKDRPLSSVQAAIWAEPEREGGQGILEGIVQGLAPGGRLYVIVSGWLARFLPEWQAAGARPARQRAGWWWTLRRLRQAGLATEELYGFQVPASLLWGYTGLALERLGRTDWADRCHFRMRAEYVARGRMALVTPVGVFVARKAG